MDWLRKRAQERSTWIGGIGFLSSLGILISPELTNAIVTIGLMLAGGTVAITPDSPEDESL